MGFETRLTGRHSPARFAFDRASVKPRSAFIRARKVEAKYAMQLRKIAQHVGDIIAGFPPGDADSDGLINAALARYSGTIGDWATSVAARMIAEIEQRDAAAWRIASAQMGRALRKEIESAPTGEILRARLAEQVRLIKSLPLEAGERVHKLTLEGIINGTRAREIAAEIQESGEVTKARATLIARTEVSRTATELTAARAQYIGSTHFIWRTAGDSDVRASHKALNGGVFRWDQPPECDPGHHALPGAIWNCRCYPEPVITD